MSFAAAYQALAAGFPETVAVSKTERLDGTVRAPTSKSYTHRALMVTGLGTGGRVEDPLLSTDTERTVALWEALGAEIRYDEETRSASVRGFEGRPVPRTDVLDVHESGTLFRLALPGLALCDRTISLTGNASFRRRANDVIVAPLRDLGVDLAGQGPAHNAPVVVRGVGKIEPGVARIPGGKSSQAVSALLLWLPLASAEHGAESEVSIEGIPVSKPYVDMTVEVLAWAGIRVDVLSDSHWRIPSGQRYEVPDTAYRVPGDYSSAAFLLAAATLVPGRVTVENLRDDAQGDRRIVALLRAMGARIERSGEALTVHGPAALEGLEVDCADTPDLVPILAAVAAHAQGRTVLKNLLHLRNKESDRIAGPVSQLARLGVRIEEREDAIVIEGGGVKGGHVDALNDHRIAMSLVVAGLPHGGVTLSGTESILKSYPGFLRDLTALGALVRPVSRGS